MTVWWERFPGRLEHELEAFRQRGLDFQPDERLQSEQSRLLLRGEIEHEGQSVALEVLYPDLFPYLRPEVFAPGLELARHQTPGGNLCLLDRPSSMWRPGDTGAWLVAERVPLLLSLFREGEQAMIAAEAPQGEPISDYVPWLPGMLALVPAEALALDPAERVGSGRLRFAPDTEPNLALRVLLSELVARPGGSRKTRLLARAPERLNDYFSGAVLQMRWVRLDQPPRPLTAEAALAAANAVQAGFGSPPWQAVRDGEVGVTAVVFPEEVRQGLYEDAWLFAVRTRQSQHGGLRREGAYLLRGQRFTTEDLGARIPKLAPLRDARVAQVGVGALGAPLALELARNQVGELRLLDYDLVEAAQIVRWPLGVPVVGRYKLEALARFISYHYPLTQVQRFLQRLGKTASVRQARGESELDLLARMLDDATLLIDASAEVRIQQLLSDLARQRGLTQLYLSATEGARGGQVVLIEPASGGGCWYCWKAHALAGAIPLPPAEAGATVQPRGCASPTFTGASFDLLPILAQAARVAAAAADSERRLTSTAWVCALDADGVGAPCWSAHPIAVHEDCPYCGPAATTAATTTTDLAA